MDRNVEQGKKKKVNEPRDRLSNGRKEGGREEEDFKRWRNEIHENATKCLKGTEKTTTGLFDASISKPRAVDSRVQKQ